MECEGISRVAVIAAGTMGAGIAQCFAQGGLEVSLCDVEAPKIGAALERIDSSLLRFVNHGLLTLEGAQAARARIATSTDLAEAVNGAQCAIETVPEVLDLKQAVFSQLEEHMSEDAILATNTSGLSISRIAAGCKSPERVIGTQWWNPAELVPLVELIKGEHTSDATISVMHAVVQRLGKVPVIVRRDVPGFAGNRLQFALLREALNLVEAGIMSPEDVDRTVKFGVGLRYPCLGPFATADLGGLDVFLEISEYLFADLSTMTRPPDFFEDLVRRGSLGLKSGRGFFAYEDGKRDEVVRARDEYLLHQMGLANETEPLGSG
jgi:3-hydroxybutyryl-CoA dehydrogenase